MFLPDLIVKLAQFPKAPAEVRLSIRADGAKLVLQAREIPLGPWITIITEDD